MTTLQQSLTASASSEQLIQVSVIHGEAYVWSAASIAVLRRTHGIVGMLTGSLPLIPQQNAFLGVPLQLFEEEVVYLMRKRAIILVEDTRAHDTGSFSDDQLHQWHEQRLDGIAEKRRLAVEVAKESKEKLKKQFSMSESAMVKKRQREERKRLERGASNEEILFAKLETSTASKDEQEEESLHMITIPSSSSSLPWHEVRLGDNAFVTLSSAAKAGLWRYPENADQRAKCAAFEALREKGYYMGKGLRFGGDFVVYPGDPLRYHSHFTATVQTTAHSLISAHELIAAGRLGTAVKKAHLLCSVQSGETDQLEEDDAWQNKIKGKQDDLQSSWGKVDFISLTWAGFGV